MSDLPIGSMMIGGPCTKCGYSHTGMSCQEWGDSKRRQVAYLLEQLKHLEGGTLNGIFAEIITERRMQDVKWGGSEHDDQHDPADWQGFISKQLNLCDGAHGVSNYRDELVKIAALAVAAIQSFDRRYPDALKDEP